MLQALLSRSMRPEMGASLLLSLHRQLHGLPPRLSSDPDARVLHLDLHPGNVILSPGGPVVIGWRNGAEGPPDLDLAVSALILAQVAADEAHEMAALDGRRADGLPAVRRRGSAADAGPRYGDAPLRPGPDRRGEQPAAVRREPSSAAGWP